MRNAGWVIVIFENEQAKFKGEVAYVKGPFDQYEDAQSWAEDAEDCADGEWQITFIENRAAA
jgi:hypothetical protein